MALIDPSRDPADATAVTILVYLVWFFLGNFGVHRMVTGRVASGVLMLILACIGGATVWLLGLGLIFLIPLWIWWVLDAFLIPGWMRP
jgi:TM2 domain-containing membrane protein YozV